LSHFFFFHGLNICEVENNSNYQGNRLAGLKFYTTKDTTGSGEEPYKLEEFSGTGFTLQCYPNPFTEKTNVAFALSATSRVAIDIYDLNGRHIFCIADKMFPAGMHLLVWNIANTPTVLNHGIYVCTLRSKFGTVSQNLIMQ
jgi:hypothetical protein